MKLSLATRMMDEIIGADETHLFDCPVEADRDDAAPCTCGVRARNRLRTEQRTRKTRLIATYQIERAERNQRQGAS